jgi:DNA polymerase
MLIIDIESFSELDLKKVALDRYSAHRSTRILMAAYCIDAGPMMFWQEGDDNSELLALIAASDCCGWNVSFERSMLTRVWGVRAKSWQDAMVLARYAGLPAGLKDCNRVPFFAGTAVTTKETQLINTFCKPQKDGSIRNAQTDPDAWALFCDYCKRDVLDTRLIREWLLVHFPMPERVSRAWEIDQIINKRGMPVDLPFYYNAKLEADRLQGLAFAQMSELTGLENPNSPKQLLAWLQARGYVYNGIGKELVKKAAAELPEGEARTVLNLRLASAKTSLKKLPKILETTGAGSRLRDQYKFYAAHTGRKGGRGAQLQNLKAARTKEEKAMVPVVVAALEAGRAVASLDALSLALRPGIKAPKGKKVVLADFKSVENRALAWMSGCDTMMQVYRDGKDPYIDFAARMEGIDYADVTAEMRQMAKPGTLGCGFGLGGGRLVRMAKCPAPCKTVWNVKLEEETGTCPTCKKVVKANPIQKTGLWRYAEMMGVEMTEDQARQQVNEFRDAFIDVTQFWIALEDSFAAVALTRKKQSIKSSLGPTLILEYRDPALRIVLPSGRELIYACPYAQSGRNAAGYKTLTLGFDGVRMNSWGRQTTYGGKLCENVIQGIGADLLMDAGERVHADTRFEIVGDCHDELICLADEKDTGALARLEGLMSKVEPWAAGLIMQADGYEGPRYAK